MSQVADPPAVHPALAAVTVLDASVDDLQTANLWSLSDAELLHLRREVDRVAARLDAVALDATREIDGRGTAVAAGASSTMAWLMGALRMHPGRAKEEVGLAVAVHRDDMQPTRQALRDGRMSRPTVVAVTRAVDALPVEVPADVRRQGQEFLVEQAMRFRSDQVHTIGRHLVHTLDPRRADRLEREEAEEADATAFTLVRRPNGSRDMRGHLDAEAGALVESALDAVSAPRPSTDGTPDLRTAAQRRGEGLLTLIRLAMASPQLPESGGEPVTVLVSTTLEALESRLSPPGARGAGGSAAPVGQLPDGSPLSPESVRRLACDAMVVPVVLGTAGEVLDIGRSARAVPRGLRRAVVARDRGCAFPGCDRPPAYCQIHHIEHWAHHGETEIHNLVMLCGHHHRVIHHGGWTVSIPESGMPVFTPPRWVDAEQRPVTKGWRHALDQLPLRT